MATTKKTATPPPDLLENLRHRIGDLEVRVLALEAAVKEPGPQGEPGKPGPRGQQGERGRTSGFFGGTKD